MKKIVKLALPITISNLIGFVSVLLNIKIMGDQSNYNLYMLTLFLPLNFWIVSFFESFRVPASAVSAYAVSANQIHLITPLIGNLLLVNFLGLLLPVVCLNLLPNISAKLLSIHNLHDANELRIFACIMLAASYVMSASFILNAVFNGIDKQKTSMLMTVLGVLISTSLNYVLVKYTGLALYSLPFAILVSYSLILLLNTYILYKGKILQFSLFKKSLSRDNFTRLGQLATPVWITYFIISMTLMIFTRLLASFGPDVVAGFGIAYRIQTLLLLPAISVGTAIGILINKAKDSARNRTMLINGYIICTVIYILITLVLYYKTNFIVSLITSNKSIISSASLYLKTVSPSYIGLSISLCFCIVLDQVGYGIQSAIFTVAIFLIEILTAMVLFQYWHDDYMLYWSIAIGNTLSGIVSLIFIRSSRAIQISTKFVART